MQPFSRLLDVCLGVLLSPATVQAIRLDLRRAIVRWRSLRSRNVVPPYAFLHFGCGRRAVPGWLNVDISGSVYDLDLASPLPFADMVFNAAVGQHVIEHLDLGGELIPLFRELHRVLKPGGELWLSCPDIDKICRSYQEHRMKDLVADRIARRGHDALQGLPSVHLINDFFYQRGKGRDPHKNLFDFDLLRWALEQAGFTIVRRVSEKDLLSRFPKFPPRGDDVISLYVVAS